ncbi:MAG: 2-amino-4-hydroxy-6-hydroxymethyldihydropteridine diphosphokinase [Bacteroidales bacterium]|jgi:2-amino-4-hydroxy-6-hydroxymethyldihydropteridine diphosphokinase|nr:2-amino-4-hydroxy-6-hydroxymethyldihydropteridine diphosphokinase [Bacteroidales bacterium]
MNADVLLALGSNLGDRARYLSAAIAAIDRKAGKVCFCTTCHETTAWGFEAPPFLNQLVVIKTALEPVALLDVLQRIERDLGRERKTQYVGSQPVYSSRTIDIDIIDYQGIKYSNMRLTLPHAQLHVRPYLQPLLNEVKSIYKHIV